MTDGCISGDAHSREIVTSLRDIDQNGERLMVVEKRGKNLYRDTLRILIMAKTHPK